MITEKLNQERNLSTDLVLCEAATPGPWYNCSYHVATMPNVSGGYPPNESSIAETCDSEYIENYNLKDAEFIAEAREGWPHAIRRAMAAEADAKRLQDESKELGGALANILTLIEMGALIPKGSSVNIDFIIHNAREALLSVSNVQSDSN